jgi:hypothetical protein
MRGADHAPVAAGNLDGAQAGLLEFDLPIDNQIQVCLPQG